jgi:probable F420-dependent oxidoreductase
MTITVGVQLALVNGDYGRLRDAWLEAEALGADFICVSDHFFPPSFEPDPTPEQLHGKTFEAKTILAAIAATTTRIEMGALVLGNGYRNPNLVADMARTIDHISGGRYLLGLGAGWYQLDYEEYGYPFGTAPSRLADFARDVPTITARLGKLNPPPVRPIPIMIGGGGEKVTLRLVAQYADIWNIGGDTATLKHKSQVLDDWCAKLGRDPGRIVRSTFAGGALGHSNPDECVQLGFSSFISLVMGPDWDLAPLRDLLAWRRSRG